MRYFIFTILFYTACLSADNYDILKSITKDMKTFQKQATYTKSNEHYEPYIVSVLRNKTLVKLGCNTLEDALKLIPNIDVTTDNLNYKTLIFRGSNPVAYGQSKLFIDGILVNNIYFDGYSEYLDMPIELIKRIEVIRGPGNESNNAPSYAGSINIITYSNTTKEDSENNSYFLKGGSNSYKVAGFKKSYFSDKYSLFVDFYTKSHDYSSYITQDALASGIFGDINKPLSSSSDIPLWLKNYSLGTKLQYQSFTLLGRLNYYEQGTAFGANYIPSKEPNYLKIPNHYIQLSYKHSFKRVDIDFKTGFNFNQMDTKAKLAPDGLVLPNEDQTALVTFPNGIYGELTAKQKSSYSTVSIYSKDIKYHSIKVELTHKKTETTDIKSKLTNRNDGITYTDYTNTEPFFDSTAYRKSYLASFQDKYKLNSKIQILSTINYEHSTNLSTKTDPKIALVYIKDNQNIFKILFSKSHRNPSWQELYMINNHARIGNKDLKAEKIETYELSHIKHFSNDTFIQSTLFFITNKNQITNLTETNQYVNSDKTTHLYGVEFECKGHFTPKDEVYFNISYTDGANTTDDTLSLVSKVLAKGYYIYNYSENLSLSTLIQYKSPKDRTANDNREKIPSQTIVDTAINYKNFYKNCNLNFSIKNIFDTKIVYPSKPGTYIEDYPDIGRNFILSFSKEF